LDFGFWILDFGVQFDRLTVRAVTEPVEVQSNDFGFWIFPTDESGGLKLRKKFIFFPEFIRGLATNLLLGHKKFKIFVPTHRT
jgi:hypothetical protein